VLTVSWGAEEIGTLDAWFLLGDDTAGTTFVLGGRAWALQSVAWGKGTAQVVPAAAGAAPRWLGQPRLLSAALCEAMRAVLVSEATPPTWSRRAQIDRAALREQHADLRDEPAPLVAEGPTLRWWTFAGGKANNLRAALLRSALGDRVSANNLSITVADEAARSDVAVRQAIADLRPTQEAALALVEGGGAGAVEQVPAVLAAGVGAELDGGAADGGLRRGVNPG
jgi:ATP-dependent Lhr-like helicase